MSDTKFALLLLTPGNPDANLIAVGPWGHHQRIIAELADVHPTATVQNIAIGVFTGSWTEVPQSIAPFPISRSSEGFGGTAALQLTPHRVALISGDSGPDTLLLAPDNLCTVDQLRQSGIVPAGELKAIEQGTLFFPELKTFFVVSGAPTPIATLLATASQ